MKRIIFLFLSLLCLLPMVADEVSVATDNVEAVTAVTPATNVEAVEALQPEAEKKSEKPPIFTKPKFSGYGIASYQATFQEGNNSNTFNIRIVRASF